MRATLVAPSEATNVSPSILQTHGDRRRWLPQIDTHGYSACEAKLIQWKWVIFFDSSRTRATGLSKRWLGN